MPSSSSSPSPFLHPLVQETLELRHQMLKQQRAEQALLVTKRRLQRLLASSPAVIYSSQPSSDYGIIFVSDSIQQFGYQPQDFLANLGLWKQCVHPEDMHYVITQLAKLAKVEQLEFKYRFRLGDGQYRWIQDQRRLIRDDSGLPLEIIGSWQDIDAQKNLEQALFHEKELAQNILESIGDAVITADASGRIQYLNPAAEQLTGWRLELVKDLLLYDVFRLVQPGEAQQSLNLVAQVRNSGKVLALSQGTVLLGRHGTEYSIDGSVAPIRNRENQITGAVIAFRDVTQHHALSRRLAWQANHDFLTGLVNRREFERRLTEAITLSRETDQKHTLCYLDLDQFKIVNDTCGHGAGDELLRQLSQLLRQRVRSTDTLARLGGDEFGILLSGCSLEMATALVGHFLSLIQGFKFTWHNSTFTVSASIGIVIIDADSRDLNSVLGAADAACYAAKSKGRNRIHVYQPDDQELVEQRSERHLVSQILKALEEKRFCLYRQPILPISGNPVAKPHYELLLRMISETGNIISPMVFIPAAERYGLMPALDRWVVNSFFSSYKLYTEQRRDEPDCIYTINLSGASINDDQLLSFLREQFLIHEVLPQSICFEVTETTAINNLSKAAHLINEIKQLGCSFALDDFGSGMSSFTYLKNLPVDYVKIDGSFVRNMISDGVDRALVECMNRIAHEIGMQTIAEFVENDLILSELQKLGVDYAQGYGIGKPTPLQVPELESQMGTGMNQTTSCGEASSQLPSGYASNK
jgi:diguanylate cyclase (GGDEF)-like protein/PAS domain S-box-containing protein